jgi:hypothetical protein
MPSYYDTHAFDEQNTEDAAGKGNKKKKKKKKEVAPGEGGRWLHPDIKRRIMEAHEKEMEQRRKKDRDLLYRKPRKNGK